MRSMEVFLEEKPLKKYQLIFFFVQDEEQKCWVEHRVSISKEHLLCLLDGIDDLVNSSLDDAIAALDLVEQLRPLVGDNDLSARVSVGGLNGELFP
jgi:hypothetical protein